jgi:hypothetical protein
MDLKIQKFKDITPGNVIKDQIDNIHNCYQDLKNIWSDNAKDQDDFKRKFFITLGTVFVFGFLVSQILTFLNLTREEGYIPETLQPINVTKVVKDVDYLIDYASSDNGGLVNKENSMPEYLGWFSSFSYNRRDSVIDNNNQPGHCWPFEGNYGFISLNLSHKIYPKSFTLVHLNTINYSNAPKYFKIFNLNGIEECLLLGTFHFDFEISGENRKNSQNFECQTHCEELTDEVLFEVIENYGSSQTCVYQLKVHGSRPAY